MDLPDPETGRAGRSRLLLPPSREEATRAAKAVALGVGLGLVLLALAGRRRREPG